MTEQEKREKAIKEMIEIAFPTYRTEQDVIAIQRLYDAGFRKVDKDSVFHIDISEELTKDFFQNEIEDARKEAIKEFVETVKRCLPSEPYLHAHIREIASIKFGVEVEE